MTDTPAVTPEARKLKTIELLQQIHGEAMQKLAELKSRQATLYRKAADMLKEQGLKSAREKINGLPDNPSK